MKLANRILSGLTAVVCSLPLFCGNLPITAREEIPPDTQALNDVTFQANGSLGALMLDASETQLAEPDGSRGGISEVTIENGKASVSYFTSAPCDLVIGFYSEDGTQMFGSVSEHVVPQAAETGGNVSAVLDVPEGMPEFYLVKAFMVGDGFEPLCTAYTTTLYTEEITRIRNSKADDFDPGLVINLDESTDTNFLVLNEDTVQIPYDGETNLLEQYDETTGVYKFSQIDSLISDLSIGAAVYYDYNGRKMTFVVDAITVDGTDAVIQAGDMELTDAFSLVKIEETVYGEVEDPDVTDMGNGLTYEGTTYGEETRVNSRYPMAKGEVSGSVTPAAATYKWQLKGKNPDPLSLVSGSLDFSFTVSVPIEWKLYVSGLSSHANISIKPSVKISGTANISLSNTFYFKKVEANLFEIVGIEVGTGIELSMNGSLECSASISKKFSLNIADRDNDLITMEQTEFKWSLFKPKTSMSLSLIAEAKVVMFGTEESANVKGGIEAELTPAEKHACAVCFDGEITLKGSAKTTRTKKELFSGKVKNTVSKTLADANVHLCDFYWSADHNEFGWGECPHKAETTTTSTTTTTTTGTTTSTSSTTTSVSMTTSTSATATTTTTTEQPPLAGKAVKQVELGESHSAAITKDGSLYLWGDNRYGQLGNGTTEDSSTPIKIMDNVKSVSFGYSHSAAITEDGSLYLWGDNGDGQLGNGTTEDSSTPIKIMDNVRSVSLGNSHSAAITKDGSLYTWGTYNYGGDRVYGTTKDSFTPIKIMDDVRSVSLDVYNSAAITEDGSLYMWGYNGDGQLGDGTTNTSATPIKIMDDVRSVSLGNRLSAAITEDGSLYTWGRNNSGQLGDGTTENRATPTKIMDHVQSVSLAIYHSAAITEDGSLYTWGYDSYGALGNGPLPGPVPAGSNYITIPIKIMDNVQSVSLRDYHSAAITEDGSLYTWGYNNSGQLGDGTKESRSAPTLITIPDDQPAVQSVTPVMAPPAQSGADSTAVSRTFSDLTPNGVYYLYAVADRDAENPLGSDNLCCINQFTADETGTLSVSFVPVRNVPGMEVFVMPLALPESPETSSLGDVTGDGSIDASDAAQILISAASIGAGGDSGLTAQQELAADVDGNGEINASDAAVILLYAADVGAGLTDAKIEDYIGA